MRAYSFFLLVVLLFFSCSDSPTKIERVNPNDPESPSFSLESTYSISTEIEDNGVIKIEWQDSVTFSDFYILSKSRNNSESFEILDTIDIDTKEYLDTSGEINLQTRYLLYNQRTQNKGNLVYSDSIFTGIDFGNISYPDTISYNSDSKAIEFNWDFETNWPFIGLVYFSEDDAFNNELILDTLYDTNFYTTPLFEKDFNQRHYDIRFFVSSEDLQNNNPFRSIYANYKYATESTPTIRSLDIINENEVLITWNDNSSFEDGFEVLRSQSPSDDILDYKVIASLEANERTFTDTLAPFSSYTISNKKEVKYAIRAFKNNSSATSYGYKAQIPRINPLLNVNSLESDSFTLTWSAESNFIKEYILQISFDGILFQDYKVFSKNTTSYTGLTSDFSYPLNYFRIKTTTSSPSLSVGLSYSPELIEEDFFAFEGSRNFRFSDSGNLLIAAKGSFFDPLELGVSIYDLNSKSVIYSKDLLNSSIHGIDIDETNDRIAVGSTTNRSVAVYDYKADSLIYLKNSISVYDVHFSNDGNALYSNNSRGLLTKHNLLTKEIDFSRSDGVASSQANIRKIALSPTGDSIAYNVSGFLNISDTLGNTIEFSNVSDLDDISQDVRFSKTGSYISLINRSLGAFIYNAKTNERYLEFDSRYVSIDHREKLVIGGNGYQLYLLDFEQRRLIAAYTLDELITNLAFLPSKDIFAIGTSSGIRFYSLSSSKEWKEVERNFSLRFPMNSN